MDTHASLRRHVRSHYGEHRVGHILGGRSGGESKADTAEDKRMIKRALGEHDRQLHPGKHTRLTLRNGGAEEGMASVRRLDRSGRADGGRSGRKKSSGKGSHVNVIVAPGQSQPRPVPVPVPAAGAGPGLGGAPVVPPRPMMPPPAAGAPGLGPPGMVPPGVVRPPVPGMVGPMMRADGGRSGTEGNDAARAHAVGGKRSGKAGNGSKLTAGARSGEGRLQKEKMPQEDENAAGY